MVKFTPSPALALLVVSSARAVGASPIPNLRGPGGPRRLHEAAWMPPKPHDTSCLLPFPYGCFTIRNRTDCLSAKDGRNRQEWMGLRISGEPCVWCGNGRCHSNNSNLCEPYDFLKRGLGVGFHSYVTTTSYEVAGCAGSKSLPPQTATAPPKPADQAFAACSVHSGCAALGLKGNCCPATSGSQLSCCDAKEDTRSVQLAAPAFPKSNNSWWRTEQHSDTECLMPHKFGCSVIVHQLTCLGSMDARQVPEWNGLKIQGQPCVWCGGTPCTSNSTSLCEPLDFLMNGEGKAFNLFFAKPTYQVAKCNNSQPLPPKKIFRTPPMPTLPPMPQWWIPKRVPDANLTCLTSYAPGCYKIKTMGQCLSSRDGSSVQQLHGFNVSHEPCVWCGGGPCTSNSSAVCEPFDYVMRGEGTAFTVFNAKFNFRVASCGQSYQTQLPEGDYDCLKSAEHGCTGIRDAATCLSSRDGRDDPYINGFHVKEEPCVWCGGGLCHSDNFSMCEPFDYAVNGEGQAFSYFHGKFTYRIAGCKNSRPSAITLSAYPDTVGGYMYDPRGPAPLVPFWVAQKPGQDDRQCLKSMPGIGCNSFVTMEQCMTMKDGRPIAKDKNGLRIAGEPCVWCGGINCISSGSSLCEPFDYLMYGEGRAFASFTAKGVYKVADCSKGDTKLPQHLQYECLASSGEQGCSSLWNAETCLASKDGRTTDKIGTLSISGQPCVWCGGSPCHSGKPALCEAFDYAVNGEGRAFATFHAQGVYRIAACRGGKPKAATLTNYTDYVPGYTYKPLDLPPLPPLPVYNSSWWKQPEPSGAEVACLMSHRYGCEVIVDQATCLGSRDARSNQASGKPCVWCGGTPCVSGSMSVCGTYDVLMHGEGVNFTTFLGKFNYQVAKCKDGSPLPPIKPTLPPVHVTPLKIPSRTQWWIPPRPTAESTVCLSSAKQGCSAIKDMATCLSSIDGSGKPPVNGLKIAGEACVWCGGLRCHSNSTTYCAPFDYLMRGEGNAFSIFYTPSTFSVAACKDGIPLPDYDRTCLVSAPTGCSALRDAGSCLKSKDGRPDGTLHSLKVNGQPCVWCGGGLCHTRNATMCEPFDYVMNGEGKAFVLNLAKYSYRLAGCKDGRPAAMTYDGYASWVPGYLPQINTPHALVPYWVPKRPDNANLQCLTSHVGGCRGIMAMKTCLSSRDGSGIGGLKVQGEPCVWCGGVPCTSKSMSLCEPFDYLMHGEGANFTLFHAKHTFKVATCDAPVGKPDYDYACLRDAPKGCSALMDPYSCLGSRDGRPNQTVDGLTVRGEPCVWCGGGVCHSGASTMCEPFDYVMNGRGRAFNIMSAPLSYRIAACQNGKPQGATLDGFSNFTPGQFPTIKPEWWVAEKPKEEEMGCLMDHRFGCYVIKNREVCLGSKDGRERHEWAGLKIHGEPCVWCGGLPCQTNSTNLCEPYDFIMHGEGKAFLSFNAKTTFSVARCKNNKPVIPPVFPVLPVKRDVTGQESVDGAPDTTHSEDGDLAIDPVTTVVPVTDTTPGGGATASTLPGVITTAAPTVSDREIVATTAAAGTATNPGAGAVDPAKNGQDCWDACGKKSGACSWCGSGSACCRSGWNDAECLGATGFTSTERHECVTAPVVQNSEPSTTVSAGTLPASLTTHIVPTLEPGTTGAAGTLPGVLTLEPITTGAAGTLPASLTTPTVPTLEPSTTGAAGTLPGVLTIKPITTGAAGTLPASLTTPAALTLEPGTTGAVTLPASLTTPVAPTLEPGSTAAVGTLPAAVTTAAGTSGDRAVAVLVERKGQDCWDECGKKSGGCSWCGSSGACCRSGFSTDAPECDGATGFTTTEHHECVEAAGASTVPATTSGRDVAVTLPASLTTPAALTLEPGTTGAAVTLPASLTTPAAPTLEPGTTGPAVTLPASLTTPVAPTLEPGTTGAAGTLPASVTTAAGASAAAALAFAVLAEKKGQDCWDECGKKSGACSWCGSIGACCRSGFATEAPECEGTTGFTTTEHHECVAKAGARVAPATTSEREITLPEGSTSAPASTSARLPPPDGERAGDDCWEKCGKKAGSCPHFCGDGQVCCRQAWLLDPAECTGATGFKAFAQYHQCVSAARSGRSAGTTSTPLVDAASTLPPFMIATTAGDTDSAFAQSTTVLPLDGSNATDANISNKTNQTPLIGGAVSEDTGIPVWVWLLLLLCLLCCVPLLLYLLGCCEGEKKKKRSAKKARKAKRPESVEDSVASLSASEMEVQPLVQGRDKGIAVQGPDLFDIMDRNHDGVISAAEFGAAMGVGQAAPRMASMAVPQLTASGRQPLLTTAVPQPMAMPRMMTAPQAMTEPQPMGVQFAAPGAQVQPMAAMGAAQVPRPVAAYGANIQQMRAAVPALGAAGRADLFDLMDRNRDGIVSASEFSQAMAPHMQFRPQ